MVCRLEVEKAWLCFITSGQIALAGHHACGLFLGMFGDSTTGEETSDCDTTSTGTAISQSGFLLPERRCSSHH